MSAPKNTHVVVKPLWHGGRYYHENTLFPPDELDISESEVQRYASGGEQAFIVTKAESERRKNPAAYDAREQARKQENELVKLRQENEQLRQASVDFSPLHALLGQVDSVDQVRTAVASLKTELDTSRSAHADKDRALASAKAQSAGYAALYPATPGTDLPSNFSRRGVLAAFGLTTYERLQGLTAEQLTQLPDVSDDQARKIVQAVETHFQGQ
ncbi:hypothetical protein [Deinococcus radiotolerans]|uniref:Uncharacterized protein n=1 Tax=Deinococcus radiotolerans TaxID=1309407 RepID=A0ABQ2FR60_9DEIO|nr:hypothetical protein [Deinococcus radiotolerans]GGL18381.1 hypothetical protein GCM10010844_41520 [Deinococcus radiotolerans]